MLARQTMPGSGIDRAVPVRGPAAKRRSAGARCRRAPSNLVGFMEPNVSTATSADELEAAWQSRQIRWRRKLGRLRLGVEPLDEQLARYRRVTWTLTAIPAVLGLMFFTLFGVFGYPVIGLVFVAIVLLPIILGAWVDYGLMAMRARRYQREADRYLRDRERLRPSADDSAVV